MLFPKATMLILLLMFVAIAASAYFLSPLNVYNRTQTFENEPDTFIATNFNDLANFFPLSTTEMDALSTKLKKAATTAIEKILNMKPEDRTFENTAIALDLLSRNFSTDASRIDSLALVHPDKKVADYANVMEKQLSAFANQKLVTKDILKALKELEININNNNIELTAEEQFFLEKNIQDFKLAGCELEGEDYDKFKKLTDELSEQSINFQKNIAKDSRTLALSKEQLEGVSERIISSLAKNTDGLLIVTADYPTMFEILDNCEIEETRKLTSRLFKNRAYPDNFPVLKEVVRLRKEKAELLGFKDFSQMSLVNKMAKDAGTVKAFLNNLTSAVQEKSDLEFSTWKDELPKSVTLTKKGFFKPWDLSFVKNQYKKKHLSINENEIQEYFPLESTVAGLFQVYQNLLNVKFTYKKNLKNIWHKDVELIEVTDHDSGEVLGEIFLDLFPREGKYTHACCGNIQPRIKTPDRTSQPAISFVLANFPKGSEKEPPLLKHNDVVTFFHEFGHAMHGVLGATTFAEFSGTRVKRDFVEAPSQMFEEWMWQPEVLAKVSRHYKTQKPLPKELIDKMLVARNFDFGFFILRQVAFSHTSLDIFSQNAPQDFQELEKRSAIKVNMPTEYDEETHSIASFGHLMGYSAGYYGYMRSKVFALYLFSEVKKYGLESEKASELVRGLLTPGGSIAPDKIIKDLLGRDLSMDAIKEMAKL
jgi:thimet oligopeptidase